MGNSKTTTHSLFFFYPKSSIHSSKSTEIERFTILYALTLSRPDSFRKGRLRMRSSTFTLRRKRPARGLGSPTSWNCSRIEMTTNKGSNRVRCKRLSTSAKLFGGVASSNLAVGHSLRRVHHAHQTSALPAAVGPLLQDQKPLSTNALHLTTWRLHVAPTEVAPLECPSVVRDRPRAQASPRRRHHDLDQQARPPQTRRLHACTNRRMIPIDPLVPGIVVVGEVVHVGEPDLRGQ